MSLNSTPSSERAHIVFVGMRNAGKSSLMNRIIGQDLAIVSPEKGTTTDPVRKAMELLPLGPVVMIDTPGLDDDGELGQLRVGKARRELARCDAAVVVIDGTEGIGKEIKNIIESIRKRNIPFVIAINKADAVPEPGKILSYVLETFPGSSAVLVSAVDGSGVDKLRKMIADAVQMGEERPIVRDLISPGDPVMLVIPIDKAAPKGRLILPQQQTIRDILDGGGRCIIVREDEVGRTLSESGMRPRIVITDSQVFGPVSEAVPEDILLTSFSILMARYKGNLSSAVRGAAAISSLKGGERILISEGCTHHRQCGDIGSVKIPGWIKRFTGHDFRYGFSSGTGFPDDLSPYSLIIHCGGCMLTEKEMQYRYRKAEEEGVPITNYGILIAFLHGILRRSLGPFPDILSYLQR